MNVLIRNIGNIISGDLNEPELDADSIIIENGVFKTIGNGLNIEADYILDANGSTVVPGLIDSHVHPTIGEFTPAQGTIGWISNYMHGGITRMVSAGELHFPGLLENKLSPKIVKDLAIVTKHCYNNSGVNTPKIHAGTVILTHGMSEDDFEELQKVGIECAKFIFYDFSRFGFSEAREYSAWCKSRGIKVKIHSGGVSRSGLSQITGANALRSIEPDIVAHVNGGPIPMSLEDIDKIIDDTDYIIEITTSGSYKMALHVVERLRSQNRLDRVIIGTDTPGGTGVVPRGMLRNLLLVSSLGDIEPAVSVCMATGNTMKAHNLPAGEIKIGLPADLTILDKVKGSYAKDTLESLRLGDLPAVSTVFIGGKPVIWERSEQTPPPERPVKWVKRDSRN